MKERKQKKMRRRRERRRGRKRRKEAVSEFIMEQRLNPSDTKRGHSTAFPPASQQSSSPPASCLAQKTGMESPGEEKHRGVSAEMRQGRRADTATAKCQQHGREKPTCPRGCASLFLSVPFVKKVTQENWKGSQGWCESGTRHHLFSSLAAGKGITCPWCSCKGHPGAERTCRRGESCLLSFLCWDAPVTHRHPITELEHQRLHPAPSPAHEPPCNATSRNICLGYSLYTA